MADDNVAVQLATHREQLRTMFGNQRRLEEAMTTMASNINALTLTTSTLVESRADTMELKREVKELQTEIKELQTGKGKRYDHLTLTAIGAVVTSIVAAAVAILFK